MKLIKVYYLTEYHKKDGICFECVWFCSVNKIDNFCLEKDKEIKKMPISKCKYFKDIND